jgi:hypothetical protein
MDCRRGIIGAGVTTRRGGPIAGRIIGVWNPLGNGATGPIKAPPRADVSTGAPPTAKMALFSRPRTRNRVEGPLTTQAVRVR